MVLSEDRHTVITVWRNRKSGLKWLRKKPEKAAGRWQRRPRYDLAPDLAPYLCE